MRFGKVLMIVGLVAMVGCEKEPKAEDSVPLDQVPPAVMKVATEQLPGVKFENAWKEKSGGQDAYEIRGKSKDGKVRDCKIGADGKVIEVD